MRHTTHARPLGRILSATAIAILMLAGCSSAVQSVPASKPAFSIHGTVVAPMNLNVLTVEEATALIGDPSEAEKYAGRSCPLRAGSEGLAGGQVRVSDSHGTLVALGNAGADPVMIVVPAAVGASPLACQLSFKVDAVPDADHIFSIQLSQLASVSFTREQLSQPVELTAD
ncbi:hypothetical protein [Terrabacter carboxydivorans]|uniref:Lipoprotein n=1 Tax=Terrabacter carboxydivorans TaxID=619730 RepID=A0ABN3MI25_9MICO